MAMKRSKILLVAACVMTAIGPAMEAGWRPAARCHEVDADFTSELASGDERCVSPFGLCASGSISHDALIKGPMFVTIHDSAPSAGMMPTSEPASMLSVSGERTLTTHRGGSLSAHVTGIFDTAQVIFSELNVITGGTGRFAGATGTLHVLGRATGPTSFAGEIRGTLCLK